MRSLLFQSVVLLAAMLAAARGDFVPPAGERYARATAKASILPGGRVIQPAGEIIDTGSGTFALAIGPKGSVAAADIGPDRIGIALINRVKGLWQTRHLWARTPFGHFAEAAEPEWKGVSAGIAFDSDKAVWISEGDSGRVRLVDLNSGNHVKIVDLNRGEWKASFTAALAFDAARRLLFVLDQANGRLALIDARKAQVLSSLRVGRKPFAIALSTSGDAAYVANALDSSVAIVNIRDPAKPVLTDTVPAGLAPAAVLAAADSVFVSNSGSDSVTVLSAATHKITAEILLRIPGLGALRGISPGAMAFDPLTGWLLVAESGINALAVIDTHTSALIAHVPTGWFPSAVAISGDRVYVANARGRGTGPNIRRPLLDLGEPPFLHHGTVSTFIMPAASELPKLTGLVYAANGFAPQAPPPPALPAEIQHVVLIVKESRAFDEIFGDIPQQSGARAMAMPLLARFGMHGIADGNRVRFSVHDAAITPNQHAIAARWTLADNFYADSESDAEGILWLSGVQPGPVMESAELGIGAGQRRASSEPEPEERPEGGTLWDHLTHNGTTFRRFDDEPGSAPVSDQARADHFIEELRTRYGEGKEPLPRLLYILLPNDRMGAERPEEGYPYRTSYVEDNDLALGRILEYLSGTPWWRQTTVFVTEASAQGGLDHVDSHRTLLLAAGPWVRRNYVTNTNADFPALLKTILQLLHLPPLNLTEATAANLSGVFTNEPDFTPYEAETPDKRVFNPSR